jgi:hypothetical protein
MEQCDSKFLIISATSSGSVISYVCPVYIFSCYLQDSATLLLDSKSIRSAVLAVQHVIKSTNCNSNSNSNTSSFKYYVLS